MKYGRLVDAVVMSKQGRPRGFGFVTFDSPAAAAVALSEPQWLDNRFVDVKRAVPGEHTQERASNKIFVGGLPQDASTEDLRTCFAHYGPVADAVVMVDRRTKRSRGFGFVRFANGAQGAQAAEAVLLDTSAHRLGGKWVEVKRATPAALLQELSPCSSAVGSTVCTPTYQQQQQARMYFDCLAAWENCLGVSAGADGASLSGYGVAAADVAGSVRGHARGRRGRRGRRQSNAEDGSGGEDEVACKGALFNHSLWVHGALGMLSPLQSFGADLLTFEHAAVGTGASDSDGSGGFEPADTMNFLPARAHHSGGEPGLANGAVLPPPGLGLDASPMKVACRGKNFDGLGEEGSAGFSRQDFLSMEVRPWLYAC